MDSMPATSAPAQTLGSGWTDPISAPSVEAPGPGISQNPPPIIIAVIGNTGAGKSTFIQSVTGEHIEVGHSLLRCTSNLTTFQCNLGGREVVLVDTPGIDDTDLTSRDILSFISTWLDNTYKGNNFLSGIIYLHRITDKRPVGESMRSLAIMRAICGYSDLRNVILATTMWDKLDASDGLMRISDDPNDSKRLVGMLLDLDLKIKPEDMAAPALRLETKLDNIARRFTGGFGVVPEPRDEVDTFFIELWKVVPGLKSFDNQMEVLKAPDENSRQAQDHNPLQTTEVGRNASEGGQQRQLKPSNVFGDIPCEQWQEMPDREILQTHFPGWNEEVRARPDSRSLVIKFPESCTLIVRMRKPQPNVLKTFQEPPPLFSRSALEAVEEALHWPKEYPAARRNDCGTCEKFMTPSGNQTYEGYIIQTPFYSEGFWSLVLSFETEEIGTSLPWIAGVLESDAKVDLKSIFGEAAEEATQYRHPMILPICLFENHVLTSREQFLTIIRNITMIESEIQLELTNDRHASEASLDTDISGYSNLSKKLHLCNSALVELERRRDFEERLGNRLLSELKSTKSSIVEKYRRQNLEGLSRRVKMYDAMSKNRDLDIRSLPRRIESQRSVLYSLIAQRDNKSNLRVAEASTKIAIESKAIALTAAQTQIDLKNVASAAAKTQSDLNTMALVAAQTQIDLAKVAARDTSIMKVIAILTAAFLPETFFAILFTVPIWKWDEDNVIGRHFWVYWYFTGPITFILFVGFVSWFTWQWFGDRRDKKEKEEERRRVIRSLENEERVKGNITGAA